MTALFLKLTDINDRSVRYISASAIIAIAVNFAKKSMEGERDRINGSRVLVNTGHTGYDITVRETPEQIMEMLTEAKVKQ